MTLLLPLLLLPWPSSSSPQFNSACSPSPCGPGARCDVSEGSSFELKLKDIPCPLKSPPLHVGKIVCSLLHKECPQSTDPVPLYSMYRKLKNVLYCTVQKHLFYILQLAVHTVQRNWISRLGRYLLACSLLQASLSLPVCWCLARANPSTLLLSGTVWIGGRGPELIQSPVKDPGESAPPPDLAPSLRLHVKINITNSQANMTAEGCKYDSC